MAERASAASSLGEWSVSALFPTQLSPEDVSNAKTRLAMMLADTGRVHHLRFEEGTDDEDLWLLTAYAVATDG